MTLPRPLRPLFLLVLTACAQASPLAPGMKAVEEIRGRKFVSEVRNVSIDRTDLTKHLREQMAKSIPYSLDDWSIMMRALQLVDMDPSKIVPTMLNLYESQVLAFYDPHSHTYYSIKQMPKLPDAAAKLADPKMLEQTVMIHELTHALQDQHFKLGAREKQLMRDTDASMAYHSVLEGEAVLVMVAHMLKSSGVDLDEAVKDGDLVGMITSASQAEQMMDPSTPRYFAELLKFPYLEGLKFVIEAYKRGGWAELDRVHANPPRSTREILHPEEYFARRASPPREAGILPGSEKGDVIAVEHLGEFHWRFLVGADNARGWVNDRVAVWRDGRVEARTKWETAERATAFAGAYSAFLEQRGVEASVKRDGVNVVATYTAR